MYTHLLLVGKLYEKGDLFGKYDLIEHLWNDTNLDLMKNDKVGSMLFIIFRKVKIHFGYDIAKLF